MFANFWIIKISYDFVKISLLIFNLFLFKFQLTFSFVAIANSPKMILVDKSINRCTKNFS